MWWGAVLVVAATWLVLSGVGLTLLAWVAWREQHPRCRCGRHSMEGRERVSTRLIEHRVKRCSPIREVVR